MTTMRLSTFARTFLLLFSGPIVWAVHFLLIYGFTGIACARGLAQVQWLGIDAVAAGILAATLAAIVILAWILARLPKNTTDDFVRWSALGLGMLTCVALVWEALPVFFVPACS